MDTETETKRIPPSTLREYFALAWRKANRRRPMSFYLLLAMLAAVLMGGPLARAKGDPKMFALALSLSFLFFFVIIVRAIMDFFDLSKGFFAEREQLFKTTLGEPGFVEQLAQRVKGRALR